MIIFYILLIPVICICLFILFVLSRHDFAILRRNITLIQIFDKVIAATIVGLVLGRLIYIINSSEYYLFHFLAFFHIIRNSGFSVFGFLIGLIVASIILFRKSKILFRMLDVIMLSFFPLVILNSVVSEFLMNNLLINSGVFIILLIIFFFFLKLNSNTKIKDGFVASVLLSIVCFIELITNFGSKNILFFHLSFVQITAGIFLILTIVTGIYLQARKKK